MLQEMPVATMDLGVLEPAPSSPLNAGQYDPNIYVVEELPEPTNASLLNASLLFRDNDADVILQSSNMDDFHVHKIILSKASPVFQGMMSLHHDSSVDKKAETKDRVPVIKMVEDTEALSILLRHIYPEPPGPVVNSFESFVGIKRGLELARKFDMPCLRDRLRLILLSRVDEEPEIVFSVGWAYQLKDVIQRAAGSTLSNAVLTGPEEAEFAEISGTALFRLLTYQRDCIAAAVAPLTNFSWIDAVRIPVQSGNQGCSVAGNPVVACNGRSLRPPKWWYDYNAAATAALQIKPEADEVLAPCIIWPALSSAIKCTTCHSRSYSFVDDYCTFLALEVERRIAAVMNFILLLLCDPVLEHRLAHFI